MQRGRQEVRRGQVLEFIRARQRETGQMPSVREIMRAVGLSSPGSVQFHLDQLVGEKRLVRDDWVAGKARLRLPDQREGVEG